ncbi:HEAT repeat domain-containing protein [Streptomyces bambusae]|uniref:HEAT repeat domain-containing protein n=1 Tax=Streptomyces bambusae TaxID=1550616 RepID=UPI001CFFA619|nr:HEAT repeat domain-containing protein [Streptomyces bambusae]MCB5169214.1 HEAT repeat domain-containing protein [Streptomyces bambusae]
MTVTMETVRQALEPEEPDYAAAARLGPGSLPHLRELARGADLMLATKAVYAASLLDGDQGGDVVEGAARSGEPLLRVAAAGAAVNLPAEAAVGVLGELVADPDPGVRKVAWNSVPPDAPPELVSRLRTAEESAAPPAAPREIGAEPGPQTLLYSPMPGERPGGAGLMPGEDPAGGDGLMPGERAGGAEGADRPAPGLMPGEKPPRP